MQGDEDARLPVEQFVRKTVGHFIQLFFLLYIFLHRHAGKLHIGILRRFLLRKVSVVLLHILLPEIAGSVIARRVNGAYAVSHACHILVGKYSPWRLP